mgnify:CR=1 FL=1
MSTLRGPLPLTADHEVDEFRSGDPVLDGWLRGSRTLPAASRSLIFEVVTRLMFGVMMMVSLYLLIAGHNAAAAAQAAAQITGVAKVIHADAPGLEHGLAENVAAQVLAIASNYSHILFPATAEVIAAHAPDIVALQEVDVGRRRSGGVDQAGEIARELGMQIHFHPAYGTNNMIYCLSFCRFERDAD